MTISKSDAAAAVANARATRGETDAAVPLSLATAFAAYQAAGIEYHAIRDATVVAHGAGVRADVVAVLDARTVDAMKAEVAALDAYHDLARAAEAAAAAAAAAAAMDDADAAIEAAYKAAEAASAAFAAYNDAPAKQEQPNDQ